MKTKTLLSTALLLLFVSVLSCPLPSAAQTNPPMLVLIKGPYYDGPANIYRGTFTVSELTQVSYLIYTVEDEDTGTVTIPETRVMLNGLNSRPFELNGAELTPEHKYLLKVQAADANDRYIQRPSDNISPGAEDLFTLASKSFTHQPPAAPKFEFTIISVTPDYAADTLVIELRTPSAARVLKYNGYIIDDAGQRVASIADDLYPGPRLYVSLPEGIEEAAETHKYKVTLKLITEDDQEAEDTYEVTLTPPPRPGLFKRIGAALAENSIIALAIVGVLSVVVMAVIFTSKRPRADIPLFRPPVENTHVGPRPAPRNRLRIRVVQAPGAGRGVEKWVTSFPCKIGRGDTCAVRIDDPLLSREHIEITLQGGQCFVTDLNSKNGTFIGDVKLHAGVAQRLPPGNVTVRLGGQTTLELSTGD